MIKYFTLAFLIFIFVTFGAFQTLKAAETLLPGNADGSIGNNSEPVPPNSGGQCDWSAIKDSLYGTESAASGGYTAVGPVTRYGRPLGKYQFIADTQNRMSRQNPRCEGDSCGNRNPYCGSVGQCRSSQPLLQERCFGVQECLMDALLADNLNLIKNNQYCQQLLNDPNAQVSGCGQGRCLSCKPTESGLLAAYHLGGSDECGKLLGGSGDSDNTGTSTAYYVCKHGGKPVPGNCTPADYGSTGTPYGMTPPTLTYDQLQFMDQSGDSPNVGVHGLKYIWVAGFQLMATELTTFMMKQVQMVGMFFDAKHQLETQRLMQQKVAQAHKDYQPSEQMCMIGTFSRNLMNTEIRKEVTKSAITSVILDRALATAESKTSEENMDYITKERALINTFCNKRDNANYNEELCPNNVDPKNINADINFTKTIDMPLTLDVDFMDEEVQPAEENIFAFLDYIFMHEKFPWKSKNTTILYNFIEPYMDMRSIISIRSVAQNSFAEIIALKTSGVDGEQPGEQVGPFMKALLREFGIEDNQIEAMIGENPSYYAQMEILTKTIYQHPEFIANLYDKPANVKRIRAALTAIKLMQDRDIHEALLRREMLMSMLLELQLRQKQLELINEKIRPLNVQPAGEPDVSAIIP